MITTRRVRIQQFKYFFTRSVTVVVTLCVKNK